MFQRDTSFFMEKIVLPIGQTLFYEHLDRHVSTNLRFTLSYGGGFVAYEEIIKVRGLILGQ